MKVLVIIIPEEYRELVTNANAYGKPGNRKNNLGERIDRKLERLRNRFQSDDPKNQTETITIVIKPHQQNLSLYNFISLGVDTGVGGSKTFIRCARN